MKINWIICFCCSLVCFSATSQDNEVNQELLDTLLVEAKELLYSSLHDASTAKYEEVSKAAFDAENWEYYVRAELGVIENLWRQYLLDESLSRSETILPVAKNRLDEEHLYLGDIFHQIGTIKMLAGSYEEAISYYDSAIAIRLRHGEEGWSGLSASYVNLSNLYLQLGQLEKAIQYSRKTYELDLKVYGGEDHVYIAEDLANLATFLINDSRFHQALDYLEQSLNMLKRLDNEGGAYTYTLNNLGRAYMGIGEFEKSNKYLVQSLRNNIRLYGPSHYENAVLYEALGTGFTEQNLLDSAIYYYDKALEFEETLMANGDITMIFVWVAMSAIESDRGNSSQAIQLLGKALRFLGEDASNEYLSTIYHQLGLVYLNIPEYDSAEFYMLKAVSTLDSSAYNSVKLSQHYTNLSKVYSFSGRHEEALSCIQTGLEWNHDSWKSQSYYDNPTAETSRQKEQSILLFQQKIMVLKALFKKKDDEEALKSLLTTFNLIDQLIQEERNSRSRLNDKFRFLEFSSEIYKEAVDYNFLAFQKFSDVTYFEDAFKYSEANKSAILFNNLKDKEAKEWLGISEDLLAYEAELNDRLSWKKSSLIEEQNSSKSDSLLLLDYEESIFKLENSVDSLNSSIQETYPSYYSLKSESPQLSVTDIQSELNRKEALLEYFFGDSLAYVFLLTREDLMVKELGAVSQIQEKILKFREALTNRDIVDNSSPSDFGRIGYRLYEVLISPISTFIEGKERLIIIPGETLNYVPFDLLIEEMNDGAMASYQSLNYLFKHFEMYTTFSASLEFQQVPNKIEATTKWIGFAPSYPSQLADSEYQNLDMDRFRGALVPLEWNAREVEEIANNMESSYYLNERATESIFKNNLNKTEILHLAMHALIDDNDPLNSRLVFANNEDDKEDGMLHAFELLNMKCEADMVVLSACNTGFGELVKGEGIISLARGFSYAGTPSVVMSHWQVDDQATSMLMANFYRFLQEGNTKGEALRLAKLEYLVNASPNKSHPYYWGSFVVLGDNTPVFKDDNLLLMIAVVSILLIIAVIVFNRRKSTENPNQ